MDSVICFMEVDLEEHRTEVLALDFMDDLVEHKDPIKNKPGFRKGQLVQMMNTRGDQGRPSGVPFSQNPKDNIKTVMGRNCLISVAPSTLGIKEMIM